MAALLTAVFERLSLQMRKNTIYQIQPARNLQNGKVERIVICASGSLTAGQKPVTAMSNSSRK